MIRLKRGPAAIAVLCLIVGACDGGASAVPVQKAVASTDGGTVETVSSRDDDRPTTTARRADVPTINGKPMWSSTRRFSSEQNARRAFEKHGEALGIRDVDAFVEKAHDFVSSPPKGSRTYKRANGDTLIYDPASNVFAVVTRDGAPRTMFKPDDGPAYWERTLEQERARSTARRKGADEG